MVNALRTLRTKLRPSTRAVVNLRPKQTLPFYLTPEWRVLMDSIIAERFGTRERAHCQDPLCKYPTRIGIRIFGDHIKEVIDGGALLDRNNILCRCGSCHTRKTFEERAKRLNGVGG